MMGKIYTTDLCMCVCVYVFSTRSRSKNGMFCTAKIFISTLYDQCQRSKTPRRPHERMHHTAVRTPGPRPRSVSR